MSEEIKNLFESISGPNQMVSKRIKLATPRKITDGITNLIVRKDNSLVYDIDNYTDNLFKTASISFENIDLDTVAKHRELNDTITSLRKSIEDTANELKRSKSSEEENAKVIRELKAKLAQLNEKEKLSFLLSRVNEEAQKHLLESETFQQKFLKANECDTFVMSVDIRRSTELMLKARSPQQFASFMTILCKDLEIIIKESYGVFDKFTGDGVLAFFPDFFSGEDGGFFAISAADRCHKVFEDRYREYRSSFISVLSDVGLGIGIDYGPAHLVQIAGGLTVVGAPVVYACRMSGAPAGTTLLNQPGYEKIIERLSSQCFISESELNIKNEGSTLAYVVKLNQRGFMPSPPPWIQDSEKVINGDEAQHNSNGESDEPT